MKSEYFLLNIAIISGPLLLSFDKRVHFVKYWSALLPAIVAALIPFIAWDIMVTGRHWQFNNDFVLPFRILNLPPGEWLFFITVPYACIFSWEVLAAYFSNRVLNIPKQILLLVSIIFIVSGILLLFTQKEYTALVLIVTGLVVALDISLKTNIFRQSRTYYFSSFLVGLMLIFNGYLTARPVVIYNPQYQLNFRIFTIPIEDFFYGFALIFLVLIVYAKLKDFDNG
ncbi:MAG: lycopene cyclase domain-containing protein [Calditrichaceae bacterium]|jgi:lycopene cyclase domain-containing protein